MDKIYEDIIKSLIPSADYVLGYQDGYMRGWQDAIKKVLEVLNKKQEASK